MSALYDKISRIPLAFAQGWETSFLLHPLNLSVSATNLLKVEDNIYQDAEPKIHQTQSNKLPLTVWHERLGYLNFPALRKHLAHHNIGIATMNAYAIAKKERKQQNTTIARPRKEQRGRISLYTQISLAQSHLLDLERKDKVSNLVTDRSLGNGSLR